jgi:hypothetical protein
MSTARALAEIANTSANVGTATISVMHALPTVASATTQPARQPSTPTTTSVG